jgi:hypothetical protein
MDTPSEPPADGPAPSAPEGHASPPQGPVSAVPSAGTPSPDVAHSPVVTPGPSAGPVPDANPEGVEEPPGSGDLRSEQPSGVETEAEAEAGAGATGTADALELADRVLDEVEQALVRLDQGTYGTCEQCGRAVDDERLAEYPTARSCAVCAAAA